ncbi:3-isopropylmalate dehydrogenase [Nocardioides caldifontis]|uniref:3-isopropylmalate dehydrogenase n=1 Tax=Nocardioides caldifontis TaxID=2588938 RepID=UPI0011E04ED0|nr:3-isopropylmalate dehydrogenase [Nocardioides caldifontis]
MHRIAVIAGDGVGPEVVAQSCRVLDLVASQDPAVSFEFTELPWGTEHYLTTGEMMPQDGLDLIRDHDAILFGAVGSPKVKDYVTLRDLLLRLRFGFDQFVNLRPLRLLPGVRSELSRWGVGDIDMTFVREGTEGEYAGLGDRLYPGTDREVALQTASFSRFGTERVIRWAFELARAEGKRLTSVSKANSLQYSGALWDEVFADVAADYPDVETEELLVDAAAMFMVRDPRRFQVVVASNLFADILTDLGAALIGGMGMAPSASLNPDRRFPSTFEPIHGSAPDIRGAGVVNPVGSIASTALMLDHLGHREWGDRVRAAIAMSLLDPATRTVDVGGRAGTEAAGDAILALLADGRS